MLCKRPWPYRKAPQASWWLWKCWRSAPPPNQLRQVSQQWLDWCVTVSLTQQVQQILQVLEKSISRPAVPLMVAPGTILVTSERPPRMDPFSLLDALTCVGNVVVEARLLQLHDTGGYAKLSLDQALQSHPYHQRGAIVAQPSSTTCFSCNAHISDPSGRKCGLSIHWHSGPLCRRGHASTTRILKNETNFARCVLSPVAPVARVGRHRKAPKNATCLCLRQDRTDKAPVIDVMKAGYMKAMDAVGMHLLAE